MHSVGYLNGLCYQLTSKDYLLIMFIIMDYHLNSTKSTLESISNPMYCCIDGVFRKLHHKFVMNII